MHLMQPAARLIGRIKHGLTPWRRRGDRAMAMPGTRIHAIWREEWRSPEGWVEAAEAALHDDGAVVQRGGYFDEWDLEVRGGLCGALRAQVAVEEHGAGKQLARVRARPRVPILLLVLVGALAALAGLALADAVWVAGGALIGAAGLLAGLALRDCARAAASWRRAVARLQSG